MSIIKLGYGKSTIEVGYDESRFKVLGKQEEKKPLSDMEIGDRLDHPVDSNPVDEIVNPGETVLIVVPDATRNVGSGQIVNILVRRLIANGTQPFEINIIFATGIHRKVSDEEKADLLTPFIAQRIKTLDHDSRDLMQIMRLGETESGIPVEVNRKLTEYDYTIIIGGINFHYFAGFTGGRKLICPGLASARTISETHKLAFDFSRKERRDGVAIGQLKANPVHNAFTEVVRYRPPSFAISTILNDKGEIVELICGNWETSHERACEIYERSHTIKIPEKRETVLVSCGGAPHDLNMIQAHKALEMASYACKDGGQIIFVAACDDGLGRKDFIDWFESENSASLADRLCEGYQVNGQTAWSLLKKAERFDVKIFTELSQQVSGKMRLRKTEDLSNALDDAGNASGYILPFGSKFKIEV